MLSHELRTPLNAVYGWAKMLQTGKLHDEVVQRAKDSIVRNADVQMQLIDDLLDLSRIVSGKLKLQTRPVDLGDVLHAAIDVVRPAAEAKNIRVRTSLDPGAGVVRGDPGRLQQVFWNLVMNAVKFTPNGGQVDVALHAADSQVRVVVTDSGEGIAPEVLPHVFERFRQADSSSTRSHGGLGLELALVKHLVELHGGTVTGDSAGQNRGAAFTVALPAVSDGAARAPGQAAMSAAAPDRIARLDGLRALVVDDDGDGLVLTESILGAASAVVRTCSSVGAAVALVAQWRPDVLVSDVEMPGEDGYSPIRAVRALAATAGGTIPAIALTAYGRTEDRARCLQAGFDMHVPKPVDPGELTAIVANVVVQRPQAR